jgi:pyruvate/2-oxoglutarate dehydrogenase complex dihydrolipoamide acyltransferase (E2) component
MSDLDPTEANSLEDLAECLKQLHIRADKPAYRELQQRTIHANGLLPGTRLKRARLGRTTLSDVLLGRKFPGKAFMLTFVVECGIDLEKDPRWEQAWDRLAWRYLNQGALAEAEQLRQQLTAALAAKADADQARQLAGQEAEEARRAAQAEVERMRAQAAEREADLAEREAELAEREAELAEREAELDAELERVRTEASAAVEAAQEAARAQMAQAPQAADERERAAAREAELAEEDRVRPATFWDDLCSCGSGREYKACHGARQYQLVQDQGPYITPLVRRLAVEHGVDLAKVVGTGVGGRARKQDVLQAAKVLGVALCMPQLGENITEGTVTRWLKREGDRVEADEPLLEVSTDKVDTELPSPASGILRGIAVAEDETVAVGAQLATIVPDTPDTPDTLPAALPVCLPVGWLDETITEGTVTRWLKREGDRVEVNEPLLEVSTDKFDTELPSPASGILRGIAVAEDETVAVGALLAIIVPGRDS